MVAIIRIEEPFKRPRGPQPPTWKAFLSMAFRPFYLLAALQGAIAVLFWAFGFGGTAALPGYLWHGHEMIWGYAGAVIVGFLLTAAATWTGLPPIRGRTLAALVVLWLAARMVLLAVPTSNLWGGALSVLFFVAAALTLAVPIMRSRNRRNYGVPPLLLAFAAGNLAFHLAAAGLINVDPRHMLHVGLLIVATVIFFMGLRVIGFFTSRALNTPQVTHAPWVAFVAIGAPLAMALLVAVKGPTWLTCIAGVVGAAINLRQLARWWHPRVLGQPLLWVLFAGYLCTALGVGLYGLAAFAAPTLTSAALHSVAVGGIGLLTLGMMSRTALGHTGRPLELPQPMPAAFGCVLAATALRLAAALAVPFAHAVLIASALCFAAGFGLFAYRFGPWLIRPRADGRP
ncbi:NnrS family protein [Azoarcus sp. KH32C]|uniref:NnrS family protein n=1 Tax=Azoarcus sp. KH32C TaxID=748247 RepID=UPI0002386FE7|nr:NnrS family protein [Azoarcus sp. KH32C]BAL23964.1 NnrS protein [Azoarcus sp. KH32C]